jgi:hypothetical protein
MTAKESEIKRVKKRMKERECRERGRLIERMKNRKKERK